MSHNTYHNSITMGAFINIDKLETDTAMICGLSESVLSVSLFNST